MNYHFLVLIILIGLCCLFDHRTKTSGGIKTIIILCSAILALESGLRNVAVGPDTYAYYLKYDYVSKMNWAEVFQSFEDVYVFREGKDAGYTLLQKAFSSLGMGYQGFLFVVALFFFFSLGMLLDRFCETSMDVFISFLVYLSIFYGFFSVTGTRQTISVGLGILAYLSLTDHRYFRYLIFVTLAFFIHRSAAILLVFPVIKLMKGDLTITAICLVGFVIFALYRDFFVDLLRDFADYEVFEASLPLSLMTFLFVLSTICFYALFTADENDNDFKALIRIYLPSFMWIPVLGNDSLFMRLVYYFDIFLCAALPCSLRYIRGNVGKFISVALVFVLIAHILRNTTPYAFFWQEMALGANYR